MRRLKHSESRDKCCQEQNTVKRSGKIHIVIHRTRVVRGQNKTIVPTYRPGTYSATKETPRAEEVEI